MKYKQGPLFFAAILFTAAPAFADMIPAHATSGGKEIGLAEGFSGQPNLQDGSLRRSSLMTSLNDAGPRINGMVGVSLTDFATGGKSSDLGKLVDSTKVSENLTVKAVDFDVNQGASFENKKVKLRGRHTSGDGNEDGDGNDNGNNGGGGGGNDGGSSAPVPAPLTSVPEPASQTLLLFGLTGLGILVYRRNTLTNAI